MTDWKYNLYLADLSDEFDKGEDDKTKDVEKCVKTIELRLKLMRDIIKKMDDDSDYMLNGSSGLNFIIDDFTYFDYSLNYGDQLEQFDSILNNFYDWADYNFVWVNLSDVRMKGIGKL